MSWDLYLTGTIDGHEVELGWWNYTHNCNRMIREAGFVDWNMETITGMSAAAFAEKLGEAVRGLEREPDRFRAMNPENGWGSYETLLPVLREILRKCREFPSAVLRASF